MDLKISCGCIPSYGKKSSTHSQLKLTQINFVNSCINFGNSCIGFFQTRRLTIYKTLLPADKFGNINLHQQTVLLKTIYGLKIDISFMGK